MTREELTARLAECEGHTPGDWELWTGCSWRRIGKADDYAQLIVEPTVLSDGQPDLIFHNGGQDGPDANLILLAPSLASALREAWADNAELWRVLDQVRWHFEHDFTSDADSYVCGFCKREKSDPESHAPYCEIGRLFAAKEVSHETT